MYKTGVGKLGFTVIMVFCRHKRRMFSFYKRLNAAEIPVYLLQSRFLVWPDVVSLPKLS